MLRLAAAAITLAFSIAPALAQSVEDFYRGRNVSLIMGTGPGGSYDLYGRLVAQHLARFIPGKPSITVEHMPGAGGATAGNYIYNTAPQDGSKLLLAHALPLIEKLQPTGIRYDSRKFKWLGAYDQISQVLAIWHAAEGQTVADLRSKDIVLGSMGRAHLSYQWAAMLKEALGAKFKLISGYPTGGELNLAMERGEIAGWVVAWENLSGGAGNWLQDKKVTIPVQFTLSRMPDLPDVPTLIELSQGEAREIAEFLAAGTPHARALAVGPNVPDDRVAALRAAVEAMMKDKDFLDDAAKRSLAISPRTAAEVQVLTEKIVGASPAFVEKVKAAVGAE